MTMLSPLMTEAEAANILRVRVATLRKWRITGMGPRFVRVGVHLVRYDPADLAAFVDLGRRTSSSVVGPAAA